MNLRASLCLPEIWIQIWIYSQICHNSQPFQNILKYSSLFHLLWEFRRVASALFCRELFYWNRDEHCFLTLCTDFRAIRSHPNGCARGRDLTGILDLLCLVLLVANTVKGWHLQTRSYWIPWLEKMCSVPEQHS